MNNEIRSFLLKLINKKLFKYKITEIWLTICNIFVFVYMCLLVFSLPIALTFIFKDLFIKSSIFVVIFTLLYIALVSINGYIVFNDEKLCNLMDKYSEERKSVYNYDAYDSRIKYLLKKSRKHPLELYERIELNGFLRKLKIDTDELP